MAKQSIFLRLIIIVNALAINDIRMQQVVRHVPTCRPTLATKELML